ncbi:UDP-N-acetylglucosamine--LPS N-acetylglucosamine transferase [Tropicimonas aquimaris]|uniref:UDP-N-acetylglucosamine--LPS N-acetylglucosamine transferase n=1 Tax=Tropicimonas aquimaris TaxID=914152 RepID=A0ABW3IL17_9RHOB
MDDTTKRRKSAHAKRPPRVLAVASSGGHWAELLRLTPAWEGCELVYATTDPALEADMAGHGAARFVAIPDASRWSRWRLVRLVAHLAWQMVRLRPDVIVSTGAAPGYVALRLGRLVGARGIWVDSVANAGALSMSGRMAGPHCDLWLTQWPHLGREATGASEGPEYSGSVL